MICLKKNSKEQTAENVAGGRGRIVKNLLFDMNSTFGKSRMIARVVLPVGASIGNHSHTGDAELYYLLKGEAEVSDNNETYTLTEGDAVFTGNGNFHSITNNSNAEVEFLAVIFE